MITSFYNYINFSKEINSKLINEDENLGIGSIEREVMNVKNMYFVDKIIQQLKYKKPKYRQFEEYSKNDSLLNNDINQYKKYLAIDPEQLNTNNYSYSLKLFVKTKTYNKLIEILYGKDYKNPENDKPEDDTKLISSSWSKELKPKKAGFIFREMWTYIDSYCDNAIEFLETGEISDAVKTVKNIIKEGLIDFAIVIIIAIITEGTLGTGTAAVVAANSAVLVKRITKYGKYLNYSKDVILKLIKIIPKWWSKNKELITFLGKVQGGAVLVQMTKHIPTIYDSFIQLLKSEQTSSDVEDFAYLKNITANSLNKEYEINRIKTAIENHSKFNSLTSSSISSYISNMPGWNSWYQKQQSKLESDKIAYIFSYWISYYCWEFQLYLDQLILLKKIEGKIVQNDLWNKLGDLQKIEQEEISKKLELKNLGISQSKQPPAVSTNVYK